MKNVPSQIRYTDFKSLKKSLDFLDFFRIFWGVRGFFLSEQLLVLSEPTRTFRLNYHDGQSLTSSSSTGSTNSSTSSQNIANGLQDQSISSVGSQSVGDAQLISTSEEDTRVAPDGGRNGGIIRVSTGLRNGDEGGASSAVDPSKHVDVISSRIHWIRGGCRENGDFGYSSTALQQLHFMNYLMKLSKIM